MRRGAPRPLATALGVLRADLAPATALARVQDAWPSAAGPVIAAEADPVAEREGTVTLVCRSAVWAQELSLMSPELRDRLNAALPAPLVRELRFRVGGPHSG